MEKPIKFQLPAPNFEKNVIAKAQPHYLTPSGMTLLTRERQPPPMYGPKGSTVPAKFLQQIEVSKPTEEPPKRPFCEACEMELQSAEDFRRHRSQHEPCPVDGCKFKGHPNVMDKHVTELHISGVFEKIKKLSTPEEIAAWREERRKKFPTLANAKMRQLAQEQRERRGERLGENKARFGRHEDRKRARTGNSKDDIEKIEHPKKMRSLEGCQRKGKEKKVKELTPKKPAEKNIQQKKTEEVNITLEINDTFVCGIRMFGGTNQMKDYRHEKDKSEKAKNVLTSLVGMYGSDDDEDDDQESDNSCSEHEKVGIGNIDAFKNNSLLTHAKNSQSLKEKPVTSSNICQILLYKDATVNRPDAKTTVLTDKPTNEDGKVALNTEIVNISHKDSLKAAFNAGAINIPKKAPKNTNSTESSEERFEATSSIANQEIKTNKTASSDKGPKVSPNTKTNASVDKEAIITNSNESSDEGPEEKPIQRTTTLPVVSPSTSTQVINAIKVESIEAKRLRIEQSRKKLQEQRTNILNIRRRKLRKQNTMLEKLLEPEIRHERNVLLQCVRFVCENNFFGIGGQLVSNDKKLEQKITLTP